MILENINKANVQAFKDKNVIAKDVISVIKSRAKLLEVEKRTKGGEVTDSDMVSLIQKLIKELAEAVENYKKVNNQEEVAVLTKQIAFCEEFLPKMMSQEEIKQIINSLEDKTMPTVMKYFKANFAGQVNMVDVQAVLKSL